MITFQAETATKMHKKRIKEFVNYELYVAITLALTQEVIQVSGFSPQPSTHVLARSYNTLGRPSGITLGPDYAVDYGYDSYGRFGQVSSSVHSACSVVEYSYLQDSDLLLGHAVLDPASGITNLASLKYFEPNRDLITAVHNRAGTNLISGFDYVNDAVGRRVSRIDSGSAFTVALTNAFGYNVRSEVTSAEMRNGPSSYEFDPIGNREYTDEAGTVRQWQANELNQYTTISNGTTETPVFDADGNLVSYNGWTYTWNGENRLIRATNSLYAIEYAYDHMGRMLAKTRDDVTTTYLWDDYNIIYEHRLHLTSLNVWGLDLSGTPQGAGGVGGLLGTVVVNTDAPWTNAYFTCYDANGNVTDYTYTNGMVAAHREFDAFGNTISSYGRLRNYFTHWFSTKPWCEVTKLSEYEYRKYSPELGRWLSRDPLGDASFLAFHMEGRTRTEKVRLIQRSREAIYVLVYNSPVNFFDSIGLEYFSIACQCQAVWQYGLDQCSTVSDLADQAKQYAENTGLAGADGGPQDAVRHCTWMCLMARDGRTPNFLEIGHFYEDCMGDSGALREMDESNNLAGALLSGEEGGCGDICHQAFIDGVLNILSTWSP